MKLVKTAVLVIIVILILNSFGMLSPETSKKVDNAVEITKVKINEFKYKGKPLTEMSLKELSSNIVSDITYLKEEVITDEGLRLSGKGITILVSPSNDRTFYAEVDASETKAVEAIEKLLSNLIKTEIKIPEDVLEKGDFVVMVEKIDGEYNVKFD